MRLYVRKREENRQGAVVAMRNKADKIPVSFKHCNSKARSRITPRYTNLAPYI